MCIIIFFTLYISEKGINLNFGIYMIFPDYFSIKLALSFSFAHTYVQKFREKFPIAYIFISAKV